MSAPIVEIVEKLRASTTTLNQVTNELSDVVKDVESFLDDCNVGVPASIVVHSEDDPSGNSHYTSLAYCRVGGKFRVAVVYGDDNHPDHDEAKPWSDCSRQEKLETVVKLPELFLKVTATVEEKVKETKQVASELTKTFKPLAKAGRAGK